MCHCERSEAIFPLTASFRPTGEIFLRLRSKISRCTRDEAMEKIASFLAMTKII